MAKQIIDFNPDASYKYIHEPKDVLKTNNKPFIKFPIMKKITNVKTTAIALVAIALGLSSCKKELGTDGDFSKSSKAAIDYNALPKKHLSGVFTGSRVLSPDTLYYLDGVVYFSGVNAKLHIKAGTHVVTGDPVTYAGRALKGVLVIGRNAKIYADGNKSNVSEASYNADSTIVFGADPAITAPVPGDFGGVIILGNAPTNQPATTVIEGIPTTPPADVTYGGTVTADNSGVLRYARIEYAGFLLSTDNEINGLTLGGVGSGTTLSHIQVAYSDDDSFEFFGGTVNADHLVALAGIDDDFDFDFGYSGTIQYAISLKNRAGNHTVSGGVSDANGIESDNNGGGIASTPTTRPTLSNFTIIGYSTGGAGTESDELENGVHFRRASGVNLQNSIIGGYNNAVRFENITAAGSTFSYNTIQAFTTLYTPATGGTPAVFTNNLGGTGSVGANANSYLRLTAPTAFYVNGSYNPANLRPLASSPAATGSSTGSFNGAFAPGTGALWTANWTKFNF
ncbi:hypothetical protein ACSBL2_02225 [Pedobacter sp. AW31-3R]|uniref:hypothetical protein n=1 Tax=Pedobacter sp. AW31-3R TaxID=3445781 RepID=UPI003FA1216D